MYNFLIIHSLVIYLFRRLAVTYTIIPTSVPTRCSYSCFVWVRFCCWFRIAIQTLHFHTQYYSFYIDKRFRRLCFNSIANSPKRKPHTNRNLGDEATKTRNRTKISTAHKNMPLHVDSNQIHFKHIREQQQAYAWLTIFGSHLKCWMCHRISIYC